jgi:hypothetical protein
VGLFSTISTKRGRTMLVKFAGEIVALALDHLCRHGDDRISMVAPQSGKDARMVIDQLV